MRTLEESLGIPFPEISPEGPDFSRRTFVNPNMMSDFCALSGLQRIHAERVPFLEEGAWCKEGGGNIFFIRQLFNSLAPGGTLSIDLSVPISLLIDDRCRIHAAFEDMLQERRGKATVQVAELFKLKLQEVQQDRGYCEIVDQAIRARMVSLEKPSFWHRKPNVA